MALALIVGHPEAYYRGQSQPKVPAELRVCRTYGA